VFGRGFGLGIESGSPLVAKIPDATRQRAIAARNAATIAIATIERCCLSMFLLGGYRWEPDPAARGTIAGAAGSDTHQETG
jgi:hypothetical protein